MSRFSLIIHGKAGNGVETTGMLLAKAAVAHGWHVFLNSEIHSVIKGAVNSFQLTIDDVPLACHAGIPDCVMDLESGAVSLPGQSLTIPFAELAEKVGGRGNTVGLGVAAAILGFENNVLSGLVSERLGRKGEEVVRSSQAAIELGYAAAHHLRRISDSDASRPAAADSSGHVLVSGSAAAAQGALAAGCGFFAAYPMTPSTGILHELIKASVRQPIVVRQAEDELAAICLAIGAGYVGTRAMTATSGGGYALMSEAIGMAGMAEIPVVIIEAQRPGPSTGLPTRTGQGDLRQVLHAGQGEFPHIVLAPAAIPEVSATVGRAFALATRHVCPVTVLLDKYLMESWTDVPALADPFPSAARRQEVLAGGRRLVTTYEHDESGKFDETAHVVSRMTERRMSKMRDVERDVPLMAGADVASTDATLVCWGSTYGAAKEAARILGTQGLRTEVICPRHLRPLPPDLDDSLRRAPNPILVEGNYSGQFGGWLRERLGFETGRRVLDYSGRPFTAEAIALRVKELL